MDIKTLSVSQLNNYIKRVLDNDFILRNVKITGEISNLKIHSSGHMYFSLKDEYSKINCVMFRTYAAKVCFIPKSGDNVVIKGRVSLYQKDGVYQLYCNHMEKQGIGDLYIAFEKLKSKLYKQGIFDEDHKRIIPKYSKKIGVITSPTGAAVRDIINVTRRRNSSVELIIYPSLVQGEEASMQIVKGIKYFNTREDIDVVIIARGGGSIEELWAFNDEDLAYEIYNSKRPIISGIGHETDFTISDFVSDKRASTPSAAAEIAVFNLNEALEKIQNYKIRLKDNIKNIFSQKYNYFNILEKNLKINNPISYVVNEYRNVSNMKDKLSYIMESKIDAKKEKLSKLNSLLNAHNPLNILNKGYSVIQDDGDKVITDIDQLKTNRWIKIILKNGNIKAFIKDIKNID